MVRRVSGIWTGKTNLEDKILNMKYKFLKEGVLSFSSYETNHRTLTQSAYPTYCGLEKIPPDPRQECFNANDGRTLNGIGNCH